MLHVTVTCYNSAIAGRDSRDRSIRVRKRGKEEQTGRKIDRARARTLKRTRETRDSGRQGEKEREREA